MSTRSLIRGRLVRYLMLWFAILSCIAVSTPGMRVAAATVPYQSYTYDFWGKAVPAPQAYVCSAEIYLDNLGVGALSNVQDFFVDSNGVIYLVDTGGSRIVCVDTEWSVLRIIDSFDNDGVVDQLRQPEGVFVTDSGELYIADTANGRVVVLDTASLELIRIIGRPTSSVEGIISDDLDYRPVKLVVDRAGRMYVKARNVFDGLLEFDAGGQFQGFIGAPRVTVNPLDVLWRRIATKEQLDRMSLLVPTEFTNVDIDERGFIFVTVAQGANQSHEVIRRLNPTGQDVLRRLGFQNPIGDVEYPYAWDQVSIGGPSALADVVAWHDQVYSVLDRRRGRVFTYDYDGNLLYVFGALGEQEGTFKEATAIDVLGEKILVLDRVKRRVFVFTPTEYAKMIMAAIRLHHAGEYQDSAELWSEMLKLNANYDMAYTGIGRARLQQGRYAEAMQSFRLGNDRDGYSKAYSYYRKQRVDESFGRFMAVFIPVCVAMICLVRTKLWKESVRRAALAASRYRVIDGLLFSFSVISRPFDGFWAIKHDRKGNLPAAAIILALVGWTYAFMRRNTGFVFNTSDLSRVNLYSELASVLAPVGLWCLVSWAITTLMEGKGTPGDIIIYTAYSLVPLVLVNVPITLISNFLIIEEGSLYYLVLALGIAWTGALLFIGTMTIHDYGFGKTVFAGAVSALGIGFVLFISLLAVSVAGAVTAFVNDIYTELVLRL